MSLSYFLLVSVCFPMSSIFFCRMHRAFAFQTLNPCFHRRSRLHTPIRLLSMIDNADNNIYEEFKSLSAEIRRNDELYYSQQPELDDEEYDALVRREVEISESHPNLLQKLQDESGLGLKATRNGRVGFFNSQQRLKRKHLQPMLSLDNVHNEEQLWAWLKRVYKAATANDDIDLDFLSIVTEPKLDGVSLSLRYKRGDTKDKITTYNLEWASTRGDGSKGQDVTQAISSIQNIPKSLEIMTKSGHDFDSMAELEVRGEVVMLNDDFTKLSTNLTFSNARNAASGILLRKFSDRIEDQKESTSLQSLLKFYAYDVVDASHVDGLEIRNVLKSWTFDIAEPSTLTKLSLQNNKEEDEAWTESDIMSMMVYYDALQDHRRGVPTHNTEFQFGDFDMDGCVHKLADPNLREIMGRSMKSPNWAVAHKFPPLATVTELLNVTVQVGRTGALTPVAQLKPVNVGGVTISRATLHNFGHMQEIFGSQNTIAKNTSVLVRRAGDVIPQVVKLVQTKTESGDDSATISLEAPTNCPACGSAVVWETPSQKPNNDTIGQVVRCSGSPLLCPPQAVTSLRHAYSRDALDVTGLSEAKIQQLMDSNLLRFPCDLFKFSQEEWNSMEELPGWGPKSVQNLRTMTQDVATRGISLGRFVYSLGIRQVGKHSSELVSSSYGTKEAFMQALKSARDWEKMEDEEQSIHPFSQMQGKLGIGPVLIDSLLAFSKKDELVKAATELGESIKVLDDLSPEETDSQSSKSNDEKPMKGFRVVFTGSLGSLTRSAAQEAAKKLGARATPGSVSKSTDLVVYGEKGGKKLQTALDFGIKTMSADEFIALIKKEEDKE